MAHRPPLSGITVLDLTRLLPGPLCSQHLADMGAEVIKIEDPVVGDLTRHSGPPGEEAPLFVAVNRNKRSVTLDLKKPDGRDMLLDLVERADVLIEGFRPGVMERLGCGYAAAAARNPRLVYCSVTGYGQDGPRAAKAGHDINYIAEAGIADQIGSAGQGPAPLNFQIADLAGGTLSAAMGILAALFDAARSGQGRHVDVSMTDCAMAHAAIPAAALAGGSYPERGQGRISGGLPCYGYYETADGRYVAVGALEPQFWRALCEALERPDLIPHGQGTPEHTAVAREALTAIFRSRTMAEWVERLDGVDCCVSPVLTLEEARTSPHAVARGLTHGVGFAFPVKMSEFTFSERLPAPHLGADTEDVLGLTADKAAALRAARIIR